MFLLLVGWLVCLTKKKMVTLLGKSNHFSCPEYAQFKATTKHSTFANDEQRLLGKSNDRGCFGYSRVFSHADGRWQAAFSVPAAKQNKRGSWKIQNKKCWKTKPIVWHKIAVATHHVTAFIRTGNIFFKTAFEVFPPCLFNLVGSFVSEIYRVTSLYYHINSFFFANFITNCNLYHVMMECHI